MSNKLPQAPYIMFYTKNYENERDFWAAIAQQMKLLTQQNYEILFFYEDVGLYRLEFLPQDRVLGAPRFITVTAEQEEALDMMIKNIKENE